MSLAPRWRGALLALGAFGLLAFAQYQLAPIGSCSSPPDEGLPACPDTILLPMAAFAGGIAVAVTAGRRTNPALALAAATGGFGVGLTLAAARGGIGTGETALGVAALAVAGVATAAGLRELARAVAGDALRTGGGVVAEGTVLAVTPTGSATYGERVYRVRMRVEPFGMMAPFEAEQEVPLSTPLEAGDRCPVWVRPGDPGHWVFRPAPGRPGANGAPPSDVVVDLAALNAARRAGRLDAAEFARLADRVL